MVEEEEEEEEEEEHVEKQVSATQVTRYGNKLPVVALDTIELPSLFTMSKLKYCYEWGFHSLSRQDVAQLKNILANSHGKNSPLYPQLKTWEQSSSLFW